MISISPLKLILLGLVLLLIGVLLPFVMVLRILEPTLLLNFLAYFASFFGLVFGMIGLLTYSREHRHDKDA